MLLDGFIKELKVYMTRSDRPDFTTFFYLVQKYSWCLPSSYFETKPDVSLFEHLKTTAAVAAILFDEYEESRNREAINDNTTKKFALLGFDVSGIQEFIYTVSSKGAAKSLKGRSFYLQLLEMAVLRYVLDTFNLPITNVIYSGGGKGFILVPATKTALIPGIEKNINSFLFTNLDTKIFVGVDCETFAGDGFKVFNTVLGNLVGKLGKKKKQKFSAIISEKYNELFEPAAADISKLETCSICGKEGKPEMEEEDLKWCGQCKLFRDLGKELRNAAAISEKKGSGSDKGFVVDFNFGDSGYGYEFFSAKSLKVLDETGMNLYFLNDTGSFIEKSGAGRSTGFLFSAGNQVPLQEDSDEILDFDEMAGCSQGAKKLGVIRGDVDNLGSIFAEGFGQTAALGQVSQLSFLLKHFFSSLANIYFPEEQNDFIVYSGGDDFFVVGPWNNLIENLVHFRKGFAAYTCFNPAFSFSASFSIFDGRFPAFKFAETAGKQEEKAKENKSGTMEKNSIAFLNKVVFWEDFFKLQDLAKQLAALVEEGIFNKSYIQLLQRIAQYNSLGQKKGKTEAEIKQSARFHRWKWYYAWQVSRLLERKKHKEVIKIPLDEINDVLFSSIYRGYSFINPDSLYLIEIPARWAELVTKK